MSVKQGKAQPPKEWWQYKDHNIRLDTYRNPDTAVKVILFRGVGTNGRQMTTILGKSLVDRGYETIAIDMPTYGVTEVAPGDLVTYDEWVTDRVRPDRRRTRQGRPSDRAPRPVGRRHGDLPRRRAEQEGRASSE